MERKDFFESLLDRKELNQQQMLLLLNSINGRWVSREWVAQKMNLSRRATLNTINDLAELIERLNPDQLSFCLSKSRGILLEVKNDADIFELTTYIAKQSDAVKMLESLLLEEFESVTSYALRHFISESTVRRDLNKVHELLQHYHIKIGRESAKLHGEEHQIRMFMAIFYWNVYRGSTWPFKFIDEQAIEKYVDDLLNNQALSYSNIPYGHKRQMSYLFAQAIIRTRKGNYVQLTSEFERQLTNNYLYPFFEKRLRASSGIINRKHSEIPFFFAAWLVLSKTMDIIKDPFLEEMLSKMAKEDSAIYSATELMVSRFQEEFFPINKEEAIRFRAYITSAHYFVYCFKGFNMDVTGNTYHNIFSERYPRLIEKTRNFIRELYLESRNPIFLEDDYLMLSYMRTIFFLEEPCNYEAAITILIDSDLPRLLIQRFIRQIKGYFSYLYNLQIYDVFDFKNEPVDIVLTTSNITEKANIYPSAEKVVISKTLSIIDMSRLDRVLEVVSERNRKAERI